MRGRWNVLCLLAAAGCIISFARSRSASAQTQLGLDEVSGQKLVAANRKLNASVAALRKHLPPSELALFDQSQQTWYRFRTDDALFRAARFQGGSLYPTQFALVQTELTNQRIAELQSLQKELKRTLGGTSN